MMKIFFCNAFRVLIDIEMWSEFTCQIRYNNKASRIAIIVNYHKMSEREIGHNENMVH